MEVAPFFVDFHHFLSIFTIFCRFSPFFCRFSRFTHFCRDLHSVEIYALFPPIFLAKIAIPATSHVFSMYAWAQGGALRLCFVRLASGKLRNNDSYRLIMRMWWKWLGFDHTCKKRVMLRRWLFWPKKFAEKVRKSRQNANRDKSA